MADIQFGDQPPFQAVIDTGSSDTWVAHNDFQCVTPGGKPTTQETCSFGPLYNTSSTFTEIPEKEFNISYVDGEFLNGVLGWERVTFAGATFNQTVGLVDYACWYGDEISSGLIGLAFPSLTSAYEGDSVSGDAVPYSPIFTTMHTENHVPPLFSLALTRAESITERTAGGWLSFGGLPPQVGYKAPFAAAKLEMLAVHSTDWSAPPEYQFYTINIDGYAYLGSKAIPIDPERFSNKPPPVRNTTGIMDARKHVIIDSGTTLIYAPSDVADAVNALFEPPAQKMMLGGLYKVPCNARPPKFGVYISGKIFNINPQDLIMQGNGLDLCTTGVQAMHGMSVLGDVFLRNVLAVFDVGAGEMRFAARA